MTGMCVFVAVSSGYYDLRATMDGGDLRSVGDVLSIYVEFVWLSMFYCCWLHVIREANFSFFSRGIDIRIC